MQIEARCKALVAELGLAAEDDVKSVVPLTGGVASDIARVDLVDRTLCVKFALPKLKVAADWRAPVHRNAAEYAWLEVATQAAPESAIELFGRSASAHGFAMEYLQGDEVYLWKDHLLKEAPDRNEASKVGNLLGKIHAYSARADFDPSAFQNRDDFHALRIEPYLSFTRKQHSALNDPISRLEDMLYSGQQVLVHGDASPKNILFRHGAPYLLDAECATMGDASFDPSFCLNHLVLKSIHLPRSQQRLLRQVIAFWNAYAPHVSWEASDTLERRVCALLPALMLARIDGKSPVEYLSDRNRDRVRRVAIPLIQSPPNTVEELVATIAAPLSGDPA
ncbi:MAG: aminoglycoside phosphotransferase family protein [Pseudomonadota bacterium]